MSEDTFKRRMMILFVTKNWERWRIEYGEPFHVDKTLAFSQFMLNIYLIRLWRTVIRSIK